MTWKKQPRIGGLHCGFTRDLVSVDRVDKQPKAWYNKHVYRSSIYSI